MKKFDWEEKVWGPMCDGLLIVIGIPLVIVLLPLLLPCWVIGLVYQRYVQ